MKLLDFNASSKNTYLIFKKKTKFIGICIPRNLNFKLTYRLIKIFRVEDVLENRILFSPNISLHRYRQNQYFMSSGICHKLFLEMTTQK